MKKEKWHITKQTLNKKDLEKIISSSIKFHMQEEYGKFPDYWESIGNTRNSHRNRIILIYFGFYNEKYEITDAGRQAIELIRNDRTKELSKLIEIQKRHILLKAKYPRNNKGNDFFETNIYCALFLFLKLAKEDSLDVTMEEYKVFISQIKYLEEVELFYDEFKKYKKSGISIEKYDNYNEIVKDVRHHQLWFNMSEIEIEENDFIKLNSVLDNKFISDFCQLVSESNPDENLIKLQSKKNLDSFNFPLMETPENIEITEVSPQTIISNGKKIKNRDHLSARIRSDELERKIQHSTEVNARIAEDFVFEILNMDKTIEIEKTYILDTNAGYDIKIIRNGKTEFYEVKKSSGLSLPFRMSLKEKNVADLNSDDYYIVLADPENKSYSKLKWVDLKDNIALRCEVYSVYLK